MKLHTIRDLTLVSSTVAGSSYNEYAAATTYALGNTVKVSFESNGTTARFPVVEYESLAGSNVGHYPPDDPTNWTEIGAENRCKMFDDFINTSTEKTGTITVVLNANNADSVGIFNIYGQEVTLTLTVDGVTIQTETIDLRTVSPDSGWYAYFYTPYEYGRDRILWEFPKYSADATLTISISPRTDGESACGKVELCNGYTLGKSQWGVSVGISDYSIISTDSLGRTYLAQGAYADRMNISLMLDNGNVDYVRRKLASVRGVPSILQGNNEGMTEIYQSLIIYGCFENFDIIIPGMVKSTCSIEYKGLI